MVEFKLVGKRMMVKVVTKHGNGGHVCCPKDWIGKEVTIILEGM